MAQSQHSITPAAARPHSYDNAVFEANVALAAQVGIGPAGPAFAPEELRLAEFVPPVRKSEPEAFTLFSAEPSAMGQMTRTLAAWRAAQRELDEHIEASAERARLRAQVAALRARYHQLFDQRLRRRDPLMALHAHCASLVCLHPGMLCRN